MLLQGSQSQDVQRAAEALKAGQLVAIPTETVYGLAADAEQDAAVAKIFETKGRPSDHPLIVHVSGWSAAAVFVADPPTVATVLAQRFWPGPLTLILPRRAGVAGAAAGGQDSVGVRCPSHPVAQALLAASEAIGVRGLAAPSANRFGRISPTTAQHVQDDLGPELWVLDGGPCDVGIESTIVDCTRSVPVILRPGMIGRTELQEAAGQPVYFPSELGALTQATTVAPKASGTMVAHYAPRVPLRLLAATEISVAVQAAIAANSDQTLAVYACQRPAGLRTQDRWQAMPTSAQTCAHELFAVLRGLDSGPVGLILVEQPPQGPDWRAVQDRLQRASAAS